MSAERPAYDSMSAATTRPEHLDDFRQARLLLILNAINDAAHAQPVDIERLAYYDFFSANPFLIAGTDVKRHRQFSMAGFERNNLSYQSASQRFTNNRSRLQFDVASLHARNMIAASVSARRVAYVITPTGVNLASSFTSLYALSLRRSAGIVIAQLRGLSDSALRTAARKWLRAETFLIDLYDVSAAGNEH